MDDNVLKMYTTKPTEARHYIQFEQGKVRRYSSLIAPLFEVSRCVCVCQYVCVSLCLCVWMYNGWIDVCMNE